MASILGLPAAVYIGSSPRPSAPNRATCAPADKYFTKSQKGRSLLHHNSKLRPSSLDGKKLGLHTCSMPSCHCTKLPHHHLVHFQPAGSLLRCDQPLHSYSTHDHQPVDRGSHVPGGRSHHTRSMHDCRKRSPQSPWDNHAGSVQAHHSDNMLHTHPPNLSLVIRIHPLISAA